MPWAPLSRISNLSFFSPEDTASSPMRVMSYFEINNFFSWTVLATSDCRMATFLSLDVGSWTLRGEGILGSKKASVVEEVRDLYFSRILWLGLEEVSPCFCMNWVIDSLALVRLASGCSGSRIGMVGKGFVNLGSGTCP